MNHECRGAYFVEGYREVFVWFGGKATGGGELFLARLLVTGKDKLGSLLAHFSWRGAFQVRFLDHILIAVDFLDIVVIML